MRNQVFRKKPGFFLPEFLRRYKFIFQILIPELNHTMELSQYA